MKNRFPWITVTSIFVAIVLSVGAYLSYIKIEEGFVGIQLKFGRVEKVLLPGLHFKVPFRDTVHIMNARTIGNDVVFTSVTKDQQVLNVGISIQWSVAQRGSIEQRQQEAQGIYATYGSREAFDSTILDTRTASITKAITGQYTLQQIIEQRTKVQTEIQNELLTSLSEYPITIEGIQANKLDPSPEYQEAIEAKQIAEVQADADAEKARGITTIAKANKTKATLEADATSYKIREERKAEAEGILAINSAISSGGPILVEYVKWRNWDGVMPKTLVTGSNDSVSSGVGFGLGTEVAKQELKSE